MNNINPINNIDNAYSDPAKSGKFNSTLATSSNTVNSINTLNSAYLENNMGYLNNVTPQNNPSGSNTTSTTNKSKFPQNQPMNSTSNAPAKSNNYFPSNPSTSTNSMVNTNTNTNKQGFHQNHHHAPHSHGFLRENSIKKKEYNNVNNSLRSNINNMSALTSLGINNVSPISGMNTMNSMNNINTVKNTNDIEVNAMENNMGINTSKNMNMPRSNYSNPNDNSNKNLNLTGKFGGMYHSNNNSNNYNDHDLNKSNKQPQPNNKTPNFGVYRPNSVESRVNNKDPFASNQSNNNSGTNSNSNSKIIISPQVQNIVNNNINNIFIQPEEIRKIVGSGGEKISMSTNNSTPHTSNTPVNSNFGKPSNKHYEAALSNNTSINPSLNSNKNNFNSTQQNKIMKSTENQRILSNNYFANNNENRLIPSNAQNNNLSVIKSSKYDLEENSAINSKSNNPNNAGNNNNGNFKTAYFNINDFKNNQSMKNPPSSFSNNSTIKKSSSNVGVKKGTGLMNPSGTMDKRSNYSSGIGLINRNNNAGPVKIQSNEYIKKPLTPDTATIASHNRAQNNYQQQYGIIKRSSSNYRKEERPSTAPAKESKEKENVNSKGLTPSSSIKRLPSPAIKSGSSGYGYSNPKPNNYISKYRGNSNPPKPSSMMRQDNSSSFKGLDNRFKFGKI